MCPPETICIGNAAMVLFGGVGTVLAGTISGLFTALMLSYRGQLGRLERQNDDLLQSQKEIAGNGAELARWLRQLRFLSEEDELPRLRERNP